jgi:hypothetical protein
VDIQLTFITVTVAAVAVAVVGCVFVDSVIAVAVHIPVVINLSEFVGDASFADPGAACFTGDIAAQSAMMSVADGEFCACA